MGGGFVLDLVAKKGKDKLVDQHYASINPIWCRTLLEKTVYDGDPLSKYCEGKKAVLCVNVATNWGLTDRNYKQLVQMHKDMKDLGF